MNLKSVRLTLALTACALTAGAIPAFATPVTNNGPVVVPTAGLAYSSSTLVASSAGTIMGQPPSGSGLASTFTANYTEMVYRDSLNTLCSGCLTFVMHFSNGAGSSDAIEHATNGYLSGFSNFLANVGYTGAGDNPVTADESNGTIAFNFTGAAAVPAGQSSSFLVIETNATNYTAATFSLIDSETGTGNGFVPAAATTTTPEPSSLILLGTGLVGLAGAARRRFKL